MHTVEMLEQAVATAERLGYVVRQEWVGTGGGVCEFRGRRWLFLDLAQTAWEQLGLVCDALLADPGLDLDAVSAELARFLQRRGN